MLHHCTQHHKFLTYGPHASRQPCDTLASPRWQCAYESAGVVLQLIEHRHNICMTVEAKHHDGQGVQGLDVQVKE